MIVSQLIELLEECDQDAEALVCTQESWPLRFTVHGVFVPADHDVPCEDHDRTGCEDCGEVEQTDTAAYVVSGSHPDVGSPYGPRSAWDLAVSS